MPLRCCDLSPSGCRSPHRKGMAKNGGGTPSEMTSNGCRLYLKSAARWSEKGGKRRIRIVRNYEVNLLKKIRAEVAVNNEYIKTTVEGLVHRCTYRKYR